MILGVNALGTRHSGTVTILKSVIHILAEIRQVKQIVIYLLPKNECRFTLPDCPKIKVVHCSKLTKNPLLRFGWLQIFFSSKIKKNACDIVINMNNIAGALKTKQILYVHNALYFSNPAIQSYFRKGTPLALQFKMLFGASLIRAFMKFSVNRCRAVVVQTDVMKDLIVKHLHTPDQKIHVIKPFIRMSHPGNRTLSGEMKGNLVYVGTHQPYKNIDVVIETARLALQKNEKWNFYLTFSKKKKWDLPNVFFLGSHTNDEVYSAYKHCDILVMPSLCESFGLPLLESMLLKIPIIAADLSYAHETCQNGAVYFNPFSALSLYQKIKGLLENHDMKTRLIEAQQQQLHAFPDEDRTSQIWSRLLHDVLESKP